MSTDEWQKAYEQKGCVDLWVEEEFNSGSRLMVRLLKSTSCKATACSRTHSLVMCEQVDQDCAQLIHAALLTSQIQLQTLLVVISACLSIQ